MWVEGGRSDPAHGLAAAGRMVAEMLHDAINEAVATFESIRGLEGELGRAVGLVSSALLNGNKLLACGNGGSAADAAHLTTEFVCRFVDDRRPFPAICLNTHGGDLTAISNDYGYEQVFARQVRAFGKPGDVLVALTTSGKSPNVRNALVAAKDIGVSAVALLGRDGGDAVGIADVDLLVPGDKTIRIQEAHQLLLHTLCEVVETMLPRE